MPNSKLFLAGVVALIAYFALAQLPSDPTHTHFTICIFHNITGYPCPACGTVRGLKYFFHLCFMESVMINPLSTIVGTGMVCAVPWLAYDVINGRRTFIDFTRRQAPAWLIVLSVVLTAANWYWNIQKGL